MEAALGMTTPTGTCDAVGWYSTERGWLTICTDPQGSPARDPRPGCYVRSADPDSFHDLDDLSTAIAFCVRNDASVPLDGRTRADARAAAQARARADHCRHLPGRPHD